MVQRISGIRGEATGSHHAAATHQLRFGEIRQSAYDEADGKEANARKRNDEQEEKWPVRGGCEVSAVVVPCVHKAAMLRQALRNVAYRWAINDAHRTESATMMMIWLL